MYSLVIDFFGDTAGLAASGAGATAPLATRTIAAWTSFSNAGSSLAGTELLAT
jgi:hypothetical protein